RCVGDVVKQERALGESSAPVMLIDFGVDMAVDFEEVEPAVVVVVEEAITPAYEGDGGLRDSGLVADVGEAGVTIIVVENLVVVSEIGDIEADEAVVLIIPGGNAHGGDFAAVFVKGEAGDIALVVEGAVPFVDVEEVGL